jgi:hypothetical protein
LDYRIDEDYPDSFIEDTLDDRKAYLSHNSYADRNLIKSSPFRNSKTKNEIVMEKEENDYANKIIKAPQHYKYNSSYNVDFKKNMILSSTSKFDLDEDNIPNEKINDPAKYSGLKIKKVKFAPFQKHKTSVTLNNFAKENKDKNPMIVKHKTPDANSNRQSTFLFNYRNQANLVKDFKLIMQEEEFKNEIEKFSDCKISKHSLERINMPPFRNVQIELITTEFSESYEIMNKDLDEPLRINHIQILSFLVLLILLFIVAILVIFLSD